MAILFSGDFHANKKNELHRITKKELIVRFKEDVYKKIKYHIILGDGGFKLPGNEKTDRDNYKAFDRRDFPILCVLGDYDPIYGEKNPKEDDIGIGETVYLINEKPYIAYLKRGKIYNIDGIKFLVLGGALSMNKDKRIKDKTWWKKEYWDEQEKKDLFKLLETDNTFDLVISHTGLQLMNYHLFGDTPAYIENSCDEVALLNNEIHKKIQFNEWWCGHWHDDIYFIDNKTECGYKYLYRRVNILEKVGNKFFLTEEFHFTYGANTNFA